MNFRRAGSLVIYGAGGHGRVVAEAAQASGAMVVGFLDDKLAAGALVAALPVLGSANFLAGKAEMDVALGVGDNAARERLALAISAEGGRLATVVHPSAVVSPSALLELGAVVLALAVINAGAIIRRGAIVNSAAVIEHDVEVDEFAHVSPNATLGGAARLGRCAHLGLAASVLPGKCIGAGSIVGAGAVVTRDLDGGVIAVGVPARPRPVKALR